MSYKGIPGWSDDILPFYKYLAEVLPQGGRFLEVGVFLGRSIAYLGELRPDLELWALDSWDDAFMQEVPEDSEQAKAVRRDGGLLWASFLDHMGFHAEQVFNRLHVVRAKSTDVDFACQFDAVFIDAAHDYESVVADIAAGFAWVKPGGILAGHDYDEKVPGTSGVIKATNEFFGGPPNIFNSGSYNSCWYKVIPWV